MLAAIALFGVLGVSELGAFGPRRAAVIPAPYYPYPYAYSAPFYNPYVAPLPAYGVIPLPLTTYQNFYGYDPYFGARRPAEGPVGDPLDYVPRKRPTAYPAVPFGGPPEQTDIRRARFEITVPFADAVVLFDGSKTTQTGLSRVYVTPALTEDKLYSATIEVSWKAEDGATIRQKKSFDFVAGETLRHKFSE